MFFLGSKQESPTIIAGAVRNVTLRDVTRPTHASQQGQVFQRKGTRFSNNMHCEALEFLFQKTRKILEIGWVVFKK